MTIQSEVCRSQLHFKFRQGTPDAYLVQFLRDYPLAPLKELIWEATCAFWLPIACQKLGQYTESEILDLSLKSRYLLEKQLDYLKQEMGMTGREFESNEPEKWLKEIAKKLSESDEKNAEEESEFKKELTKSEEASSSGGTGIVYSLEGVQ